MEKDVEIKARAPEAMREAMALLAESRGEKISVLIREAVREKIERHAAEIAELRKQADAKSAAGAKTTKVKK